MSAGDDIGPEHGGDDIVAAEYVLGVLAAGERQLVSRRIDSEPDFMRLIERWEGYFFPLAAGYVEVEAPGSVKIALDRRLFSTDVAPPRTTTYQGFWSSLAFWRGLAVAAVAALALYVAVPLFNPTVETPQPRLVASLAADGSDVRYLAVYDAGEGQVALSHVSGERTSGHDFELWMIEGGNAPVSMGVVPVGASAHIEISPEARQKLASGAVLAVSLEPSGGSPTGQPTGPVVAAGELRGI